MRLEETEGSEKPSPQPKPRTQAGIGHALGRLQTRTLVLSQAGEEVTLGVHVAQHLQGRASGRRQAGRVVLPGREGESHGYRGFSKPQCRLLAGRDSCTGDPTGLRLDTPMPLWLPDLEPSQRQEGPSWLLTIGNGPREQRIRAPHARLSMVGAQQGSLSQPHRALALALPSPGG